MKRVLVLGWYNRQNLGDDCFADAFRMIFPDCMIECTDEIKTIPKDVDILVLGGGDIINPYFMNKIKPLMFQFQGPCFAVGVGIPYSDNSDYISLFNHSFVRSSNDLIVSLKTELRSNVTQMADLSWLLPVPDRGSVITKRASIGICLAQPILESNAKAELLLNNIVTIIKTLSMSYDVYLLAFNYSNDPLESDKILNEQIMSTLSGNDHVFCPTDPALHTYQGMMALFKSMDIILCMRYHATQFALKAKVPFVAVYTTQKIQNLLEDVDLTAYGYRLPVDNDDKPIDLDANKVLSMIDTCAKYPNIIQQNMTVDIEAIRKKVYTFVAKDTLFTPCMPASCNQIHELCIRYISTLTDDSVAAKQWFYNGGNTSIFHVESLDDLARTLLFATTNHVTTPYLWGMVENMKTQGLSFKPVDAINWVFNDFRSKHNSIKLKRISEPVHVSVDLTYFLQDDFKEHHRSGWSYCIDGLMHFDTQVLKRDPLLLVDTYIDRTFQWGCIPLKAAGIIPYTKPWIGFIHHTFEESHGPNNCVMLFKNADFLSSLASCKCLISLTQYLASQLKRALIAVGHGEVPVEVMTHAMEFVTDNFTMEKLMNNPNKKIINIGSWMRDPYSIYELPIHSDWRNPLGFQKTILIGKDMNSCQQPTWLTEHLDALQYISKNDMATEGNVHTLPVSVSDVRRRRASLDQPSNIQPSNMLIHGMVHMLRHQFSSVHVLDKLTNTDFDQLLTNNIVFLNLVDCSAVNTVLECIVRDTILLVNRHPALEELLGINYPGFYLDLTDAALMVSDLQRLQEIHKYLTTLPKEHIRIEHFVKQFQEIVQKYV
jgi:polysaccharide pyruvyl transferase WcaK-like protein